MIGRIKFLTLFLILTLPMFVFGQTGKVVGKVTDLETGEPLIGANVLIEGTSLGAATDENGDYIILNVPPSTYSIKARFIGYREQINSNVGVSVNLTTEANFALPTEEYTTDIVIVQVQKPLVDKNITNSTSVVKAEDIENLPVRGVNAIVATQAGVVSGAVDGGLNIRGSRNDAVAYMIDGVMVNNPVFGGAQSGAINNAVEEIQVQAGGYSAEFGGANGGIISTSTKTGAEKYNISFEGITDNFAEVGDKFLGTYSTGYSELVLTVGGPLIPSYKKIRFFVAGSNMFSRTPAGFHEGFNYQDVYDPGLGESADTFDYHYPNGYRLNAPDNQYQLQGNITYDLNPFSLRLNANFFRRDWRTDFDNVNVIWNRGVDMTNVAAERSAAENQQHTISTSLKATHVLSNNSFYDVILSYFDDFYVRMDPIFKHDITSYGDSILNDQNGRLLNGLAVDDANRYQTRYNGMQAGELNGGILKADYPISDYRKQKTQTIGGKLNFLYQLGKHHEFKTGGEFTYHTIRRYRLSPQAVRNLQTQNKAIADGPATDVYNRLDNYGYDVYGNTLDDGRDGPKHPTFAAYYIQDKMEFSDLVLNLGFRLDYIDIDSKNFENPSNVQFNDDGEVDENSLVDVDPILQISPRIGFSFPVTDQTVFHAQYGKFIQQTRLRDVYQGYNLIADNIKGGFAIQAPVGFGLRPERTTQYEIGFRQQIGDFFAFDITGFYRDIKDQVQLRQIFADEGAAHKQYYAWVNGDFSTIKGIELKFDLRRTNRLAFTLDYTFSDALGTGSNPSSGFRAIWQSPTATPFLPQQIAPLDFNQSHRGFLTLDYRFGKDDGGPILQQMGLNLMLSFNSGFNYTQLLGYDNARIPTEPLNSSTTPWTFNIDLRWDKSFIVGPLDLNVYVWVMNLLNTQNSVQVYPQSGDAKDDGFLASETGQATADGYTVNYGEEFGQLYQDIYRTDHYNRLNFAAPRQIRLGLRINY